MCAQIGKHHPATHILDRLLNVGNAVGNWLLIVFQPLSNFLTICWEWMRAFSKKLVAASGDKPVEFTTLCVAVGTLAFLMWQLWDLDDTLESQAYSYIGIGLTELDKMSVENSKLRPYFQQNKAFPSDNEEERLKVRALADAKLDFFDSFYTQHGHIPWRRHTMEGWQKYFEQSFKCSMVLRETFCLDEHLYGNHLREFVRQTFAPTGLCKNGQAMQYSPTDVNCHE